MSSPPTTRPRRPGPLPPLAALWAFGLLHAPLSPAQETGSSENLIVKKTLNEDWFLSSRNLLVTRDGFGDFFFGYLDINLGYELGDDWSVEGGYRHARLKLGDDFWRDEYRPSALLTYARSEGGWYFSNRHRLEYRVFEGDTTDDRFRYRNETRLIAPHELTSLKLKPFVEEEFFYEFNGSEFNLNWLTVGVRHQIADGVTAKLGYRWQAQKFGDDWSHRHVLVTGLLLFF